MAGDQRVTSVAATAAFHRGSGFGYRPMPSPRNGGLYLPDQWVWCGSAIRDDEGLYHLFASAWDVRLAFSPHWITNSQIIHATSANPEGPYQLAGAALPQRGAQFWDGRMTHNPSIHRVGKKYVLFYTGTTFDGPSPAHDSPASVATWRTAHANQRVGLATADTPWGPWERQHAPILEPRKGRWDGLITTNPAPCVLPDGSILVIYKSVEYFGAQMRLGIARASHLGASFERVCDEPILDTPDPKDHIEDPYVWWNGHEFEIIMKCSRGGIHGRSADALHWTHSSPALAYSKDIEWSDGTRSFQPFLERPQLLFHDGRPTHLFLAAGDSATNTGDHATIRKSWTMVIPLSPDAHSESGNE